MKVANNNQLSENAAVFDCVDCVNELKNASEIYGKVISDRLEKNGLRASYKRVLEPLVQHENLTQLELVKITSLKAPTISITLRNMEREGIVTRVKNTHDRRETHVAVTERGRRMYSKLVRAIEKVESDMLCDVSEEEKNALCSILEKISKNLENML